MAERTIKIVSFAHFDQQFLRRIAGPISKDFHASVIIKEGHLDLTDFLDTSRRQYNGNAILEAVQNIYAGDTLKTIGLFNVDLFIPILTYIFGQAYLSGKTAIASAYRLSSARYGMKEDPILLQERVTKEVVHELGHTFGLIHCRVPACVMGSSTYVEEIDQKSDSFCSSCQSQIND